MYTQLPGQCAMARRYPQLRRVQNHTQELLSNVEKRLAEEMGQAVGAVVAVPNVTAAGGLLTSFRNLKGRLELVESVNQGWGTGHSKVFRQAIFNPRRIGGNPPDSTVETSA